MRKLNQNLIQSMTLKTQEERGINLWTQQSLRLTLMSLVKFSHSSRSFQRISTGIQIIASVFLFACTPNMFSSSLSPTGSGSPGTTSVNTSASASPSPSPSFAPGPRAVKIIFRLGSSPAGSFDSDSALSVVGSKSFKPKRIYAPDSNTVIASQGPGGTNWPSWLSNFEIGISGTTNSGSGPEACANFAKAAEAEQTNCKIGPNKISASCGAPSGQFRVSEVDCTMSTTPALVGTGGQDDGVFIRATFNRAALGSNENLLAVLEYAASSLNPAPADPSSCFSPLTGVFSPEGCSDFVWKAFLKRLPTDNSGGTYPTLQPLLMLIPPMFSSVLGNAQNSLVASGVGVGAKQFIIPLAIDSSFTILQISRMSSNFPNSSLLTYCTLSGLPPSGGNSPLCAGVVFYSLTLYRI